MALVKYGAIITDMKGKIGGTIFQGGPFGPVAKNGFYWGAIDDGAKLSHADAGKGLQRRVNLSRLATDWKNLTQADRDSWNTAAPNFPITNKYGVPVTASGFLVYMMLNLNLKNSDQAEIHTAPAPGVVQDCNAFTVSWLPGPGTLSIVGLTQVVGFTNTIYATRTMREGSTPKQSDFKAIKVLAAGEVFPYDFTASYEDLYGSVITGGRIHVYITSTNNNTGQQGLRYGASVAV